MKLIHKFETLHNYYTYLFDNKLINIKHKTKYTNALDYLGKYLYALDNKLDINYSNKYNNPIWQLWLQGKSNMPKIAQICTKSVEKHNPSKEIIFLTDENFFDYVELPDYIIYKHQKGIISKTHLSDIIRLFLLYKYGGTWIDSTVFLTDKIPSFIDESDFFAFKSINGLLVNKNTTLEQYKLICNYMNKEAHLASNWFMHSKSGNKIIGNVLKLILEYWLVENKLINYFLFHYLFTIAIFNNDDLKNEYINMPDYSNINVHLLQKSLFERYNPEIFNEIKKMSDIHKLTYKNLNKNIYNDSFLNYILQTSKINSQERERERERERAKRII